MSLSQYEALKSLKIYIFSLGLFWFWPFSFAQEGHPSSPAYSSQTAQPVPPALRMEYDAATSANK